MLAKMVPLVASLVLFNVVAWCLIGLYAAGRMVL